MKTENIRKAMRYLLESVPLSIKGEALDELAAIEGENAAQRAALSKIEEYAVEVGEYMDEIVLKATACYSYLPTGKVLVDVEVVREALAVMDEHNPTGPFLIPFNNLAGHSASLERIRMVHSKLDGLLKENHVS